LYRSQRTATTIASAMKMPRCPVVPMRIGNAAFPTSWVIGEGEPTTFSGPLTAQARSENAT